MCRQVIKVVITSGFCPGWLSRGLRSAQGTPGSSIPSRRRLQGSAGDAQGRTEPPCEGSGPRSRLSQAAASDERSHGIPGASQDPSGTLSPGRSHRPRGQRRLRCDPRPGVGALPRAARHAGSRSPRPPHSARRPSPAAAARALRAPGARRSLGPEPPPLPGALPGLPRPRTAAPGAPLGRRFPLPARGAPRGS